ncbi:MAG TPA: DUF3052 family protein [Gemmatimonadaceae bacterium]|nr:DUF3052 family protein [Gemmatimonadaceae bacterium]
MGYETTCKVRVDDRAGTVREAQGKVLLETDELIVRGDARIRVPRRSIERVARRDGVVSITAHSAIVTLTLGADAALRWQKKLEETPKRLIDKLDVRTNAKVWLWGMIDPALETELVERTTRVSRGRTASGCDVVFVAVDSHDQLDRIDRARAAIGDDGAIWVVHPKGPRGVADTTIFARAKQLGLAYTKVARVSDTHTAEKLVLPRAVRAKPGH